MPGCPIISGVVSPHSFNGNTVVLVGGCIDHRDELTTRLEHAPGDEARKALGPTAHSPHLSRWTLRAV